MKEMRELNRRKSVEEGSRQGLMVQRYAWCIPGTGERSTCLEQYKDGGGGGRGGSEMVPDDMGPVSHYKGELLL